MNDLVLPLSYPHPEVPAPGTAIRVAPGVHWLRMPLPFALNHINLWALEDDDGWCLIDTGFGIEATQILWQQLFDGPLAGRPVSRIIVTHYHPDHVGAAAWLVDRWGAEFWMTEAEFLSAHAVREGLAPYALRQSQEHFRRHGLNNARLKAQETRGNAYRLGVPSLPASYRRLMDGDRMTIGGRTMMLRLGELAAAIDAPRTAAELLPVLFPRPLDDHQLMFAMGEIIAHLNYLAYNGRAQRELSVDALIRYGRGNSRIGAGYNILR